MKYKGYTITAEVETYDFYSVNEDGSLGEKIEDGAGFEITGYMFTPVGQPKEAEFMSMNQCWPEQLREIVDGLVAAKAVV